MIKIFLSVRNRLAITKKCIVALRKHSKIPLQIYVYNNLTDYKLDEHFAYFYKLLNKGIISQLTFNTERSTFGAFSKASACNQFGLLHEQDPNKKKIFFLLFLDNDIILHPDWDTTLVQAWRDVKKIGLNNVKVIGQLPGGIKSKTPLKQKIAGVEAKIGKLGGSALWSVQTNFFDQIGYLNISKLIGHNKKHDQHYWNLLDRATKGESYILGLKKSLGLHAGKYAGSVCNRLTVNNNDTETIKFKKAEKEIQNMSFDEFYKKIKNDKSLVNTW